jgi:antibiotic biosynthesis monooxygenase (ABM) superfamily enzyme
MANDSLEAHPVLAKLGGTMVVSFMTYGAILLVSGGISFWLYLRHTQGPTRDGQ